MLRERTSLLEGSLWKHTRILSMCMPGWLYTITGWDILCGPRWMCWDRDVWKWQMCEYWWIIQMCLWPWLSAWPWQESVCW